MVALMFHLFFSIFVLFLAPTLEAIDIGIGIGIGIGGPPSAPSPPAGPRRCEFVNEKQYQAYLVIQRFKRTITCDPLNITGSWVGPSVCNYAGFFCESPPNLKNTPTIASVDFNGYTLAAPTISGFIDGLPDLAFFHANSNNFAGTLPCLSALPFLYELDVSNNRMTGPYPSATISGIKQLLFLDIRYNAFSGSVPLSVFRIKLDVLFLNNNNFGSRLPANLGDTTAEYLTLANNGFTGTLPRSIGKAAETLIEVLFLNNRLTGCLPFEVGYLRKATVFDIGNNRITGTIPKSFACLAKMEQLNLANNHLYGEVPDCVCRIRTLENFTVSGNYFTSLGPECRWLLKQGKLHVDNNCIPHLPNQRSPSDCYAFLCKPKTCPESTYIPCKAELDGADDYALPHPLQSERHVTDGDPPTTYSVLHSHHQP